MAFRAPLLGYNTNVRHKGKLYHIQTEDSGIDHPHVITHLFADGGRIVASKKTSYADRVGNDGLPELVKKLMQAQHKAMFIALRDGAYDEDSRDDAAQELTGTHAIASDKGEVTASKADDANAASSAKADAAPATKPEAKAEPPPPPRAKSELPKVPDVSKVFPKEASDADPEKARGREVARPPEVPRRPDGPRKSEARPPLPEAGLYRGTQSTAALAERPRSLRPPKPARSLFGGDLLNDKSLDEVILNYLVASEKDG